MGQANKTENFSNPKGNGASNDKDQGSDATEDGYFWSQLINYLRDVKCPDLNRIFKELDTVEERAKINVKEHLGEHALISPFKTKTDKYGKYYGELNADGKQNGKGIKLWNYGDIDIGHYEDDLWGTGHYIQISTNGRFIVGEYYLQDGVKRDRYTQFNTDGTETKNDRKL